MSFVKRAIGLLCAAAISSCGGTYDDLRPSGEDLRPQASSGEASATSKAADFTLSDTLGRSVNLYETLATGKGVVLYFTMWCPICAAHMDHMLNNVTPLFPDIRFFLVDYVSGTVQGARGEEVSNGYSGTAFTTLVDSNGALLGSYGATMGTTVVIASDGEIVMNEDYKDGKALTAALEGLQ
ncbi:MAG: redoxin family protein [Nitrospinae bacterium]|nr:redoxin family protein [Nitrospinota bacterium]